MRDPAQARKAFQMAKGKRTSTVDPNESKAAKFVRRANMRIGKALALIEQVGKLGTPSHERTEAQIAALHKAVVDAADDMKAALAPRAAGAKSERRTVL